MSDFEWHTESDSTWSEQDWSTAPDKPRRRRPRRAILIILVVASAAYGIYLQLEARADDAAQAAREDLLATHELLYTALEQHDQELFSALLSGRDMAWTTSQQSLFSTGSFLDREFIGLQDQEPLELLESDLGGGGRNAQVVDIELSPDLMAAEVTTAVPYAIRNSLGLSETVELRHSTVYRRGSDRWLLAPPTAEFWGSDDRIRMGMLVVTYPERDHELVVRLGSDLASLIQDACRTLRGINCPVNLRVTLQLETSPASLLAAADAAPYDYGRVVALPAPSLVGLPADDSSYRAIYRAYGERVLASLVGQLSQWDCCGHAMMFQALLEWEKSQLGLGEWPVTPDYYRRVLRENLTLNDMAHFWLARQPNRLDAPDGWQVYTLLDFLLRRFPRTSIIDMQRELSRWLTLEAWLRALYVRELPGSGGGPFMTRLETEWRRYAGEAVIEAQEPPPIPWPDQDVIALCSSGGSANASSLFRYDASISTWDVELADTDGGMFMHALNDGHSLVLSGFDARGNGGNGQWETSVWNGEQMSPILQDGEQGLSLGQTDPGGRLLMLYTGTSSDTAPGSALVDLDSCQAGGCEFTPINGLPLWSPGGSLSLMSDIASLGQGRLILANRSLLLGTMTTNGWRITLSDSMGNPLTSSENAGELTIGTSPFWLDDNSYGYVGRNLMPDRSYREELILMSTATGLPDAVWDLHDLVSQLPDLSAEAVTGIVDVMANPSASDGVLVVVSDPRDDALSVIGFDTSSGEATLLLGSAVKVGGTIGTSPDGRWLTVSGVAPGLAPEHAGKGVVYVVDLTGPREPYRIDVQSPSAAFGPAYDWSADGTWLVVAADQHTLNLIAPALSYQHLVPYSYDACSSVAWIKKQ